MTRFGFGCVRKKLLRSGSKAKSKKQGCCYDDSSHWASLIGFVVSAVQMFKHRNGAFHYMTRVRLFSVLLFLACVLPVNAQTPTLVTGTITDPNGLPYSFAKVSAQLVPSTGTPTILVNNVPVQIGGQQNSSTDVNGSFTMNLFCNSVGGGCSVISPSGTQWKFTVNSTGALPPLGTGPQVCTAQLTISGASQSVSASFASCPALGSGPLAGTYNTPQTFNAGGSLSGTFTGSPTFSGAPTFSGGGSLSGTFTGSPTFSGAPTFSGGGSLSGTFTGSPTFSGAPTFSGGGSLSGTFTGSPTFSGAPAFSGGGSLSGTFTGNPTLSGNVILSGTDSVKTLNSTQYCDQFSGATADVQVTNCIAALPSTGGTADARGLIGTQTVASEIDVGNSTTKFVTLLVPCGATWNVTITGGATSAIKVFGGSSVLSTCAQNNAFKLKLAAAGNVASLVTNDQTCANCSAKIQGLMLYNTLAGTVANAMMDLSNLGNNAEVEGVNIASFSGKGLWIHDTNSETIFKAVNVDGVQTAGNVPCTIETTSASLQTMRFYGLDCQHPGATKKVLVIDGHSAANLCCLSFFGSHFEGSNTDTTTPFVSVADAKNIAFYSPLFNSLDSGTTNYGVQISQTAANLTEGVTVVNATQANGNFINDTISSRTISGGSSVLPFYQYSQNALVSTSPMVLAKVDRTGNSADIALTTLYAIPASAPAGWYRLTCYIVVTQAATTSSTMPGCKASFTDQDTNTVANPILTNTSTANVVGTTNSAWLTTGQGSGVLSFYAKAGTNIQYGSSGYVSSGATPMLFALHARLEYLGSQ